MISPRPIRQRPIRQRPLNRSSCFSSTAAGPPPGISSVHSSRQPIARDRRLRNTLARGVARGREMRKQDVGFDYHRYRQLLAEAVDENKRLALINVLIEERARERLEAQRVSDRAVMTANVIATVLRASRG